MNRFITTVKNGLKWEELIELTYSKRISLSTFMNILATPDIYFNKETNKEIRSDIMFTEQQ